MAETPPGRFLPPTDRPPPSAGRPPPPPPPAYPPPISAPPGRRTSGQAVASLVLAICGLIIVPLICSGLAIFFGIMGRRETERDPTMQGRGIATAGLTIGIVGLALWLLLAVVVVARA